MKSCSKFLRNLATTVHFTDWNWNSKTVYYWKWWNIIQKLGASNRDGGNRSPSSLPLSGNNDNLRNNINDKSFTRQILSSSLPLKWGYGYRSERENGGAFWKANGTCQLVLFMKL